VEVDSSEFKEKMHTFKNQFIELSALKAMVLTIGRIRQESQLDRDEIDRYKSAHIAYQENKKNLIPYFSSYNKAYHKPEVIVEALNNFLNLIYYADDKISEEEKNDILTTCLSSLANIKDQDFRYRLTVRENLILFGSILKNKSDFYNDMFIPSLIGVLTAPHEFDEGARFTVAQALAALGQGNDECVNILIREMEKTDNKKMWRRTSAAVSLVFLNNQKGHDFLFNEMKPYRGNRLIAGLSLGEAVAKSDAIRLDKDDRRKLLNCLEEGVNRTHNLFQKDYAMAILNKLKEKEEFKSLN
jgi:hypothetical protein